MCVYTFTNKLLKGSEEIEQSIMLTIDDSRKVKVWMFPFSVFKSVSFDLRMLSNIYLLAFQNFELCFSAH
jgi:hypothetical protein